MKKDIILFDIDGTLTDTKSMAEIFYKKLSEIIGVSTNEIIKMKDDYKLELESYTDYHPKDLLEFKSEYCFTIEEALIQHADNLFPREELAEQLAQIEIYKSTPTIHRGFLTWKRDGDDRADGVK